MRLCRRTEEVDKAAFDAKRAEFSETIGNDINTSLAITAVYDVLKADMNDATKRAVIEDFDRVLALDLTKVQEKKEDSAEKEDSAIMERSPFVLLLKRQKIMPERTGSGMNLLHRVLQLIVRRGNDI